jgi:hypothetical protein
MCIGEQLAKTLQIERQAAREALQTERAKHQREEQDLRERCCR